MLYTSFGNEGYAMLSDKIEAKKSFKNMRRHMNTKLWKHISAQISTQDSGYTRLN